MVTGGLSSLGLTLLKKATPQIFGSLKTSVGEWREKCKETENKWDDVFSDIIYKVVSAVADSPEAQADPAAADS
jgi:hypothetical protein